MSGVIPPIFASSIILLPATVVGWFATGASLRWLKDIASRARAGQPIYVMLYAAAIVFFCFFYTALVFNSRETADNLKKSGAFIRASARATRRAAHRQDPAAPDAGRCGVHHAGVPAARVPGAEVQRAVLFRRHLAAVDHRRGDDGLLAQVQNYMMSQQYESLLKKANFKAG